MNMSQVDLKKTLDIVELNVLLIISGQLNQPLE